MDRGDVFDHLRGVLGLIIVMVWGLGPTICLLYSVYAKSWVFYFIALAGLSATAILDLVGRTEIKYLKFLREYSWGIIGYSICFYLIYQSKISS